MRLKIIRSREGSPLVERANSTAKIVGSVSIKKIKLINSGKIKPQLNQSKSKKSLAAEKKLKKQPSYYRATKVVELSFEEEIDVDQIYKENSILDEHKIQRCKKAAKGHRRQVSEFEEEGRENLSSEGNENDTNIDFRIAKPPKIQQEKFNDLNKKTSRNTEMCNTVQSKTDKLAHSRNQFYKGQFLSNKFAQQKLKEDESRRDPAQQLRKTMTKTNKAHALNRSRNRGRNHDSNDSSNCELATSSILSDKLRESLSSMNARQEASKRYAKNFKNLEKEMDQNKLRQKAEIKDRVLSDAKSVIGLHLPQDKHRINNQLLGNIIKNNINELNSKNMANLISRAEVSHSKTLNVNEKYTK
jgi:hypothetical protein